MRIWIWHRKKTKPIDMAADVSVLGQSAPYSSFEALVGKIIDELRLGNPGESLDLSTQLQGALSALTENELIKLQALVRFGQSSLTPLLWEAYEEAAKTGDSKEDRVLAMSRGTRRILITWLERGLLRAKSAPYDLESHSLSLLPSAGAAMRIGARRAVDEAGASIPRQPLLHASALREVLFGQPRIPD